MEKGNPFVGDPQSPPGYTPNPESVRTGHHSQPNSSLDLTQARDRKQCDHPVSGTYTVTYLRKSSAALKEHDEPPDSPHTPKTLEVEGKCYLCAKWPLSPCWFRPALVTLAKEVL